MQLFGLTITRTNALMPPVRPLSSGRGGGWWPIVREPFTGAWQQNQDIRWDSALSYFAVFACTTLIASDIGKLRLRLVVQDEDGIWTETTNPAYAPVLRKPNRYQTVIKFCEQWIVSKLVHGNTYALKARDDRGVVRALYVLDPTRVTPLVAPDGAVYYQLGRDDLSSVAGDRPAVPASEIIHDLMVALFHPLIGVSPIFACGLSALEGLHIQNNSSRFFANGSQPGGVLTAPGAIKQETADRLKAYWDTNFAGENVGKIAVLGDGLKYDALSVNAVDAQLIEQLKWTAETVCSCYHVPPSMIGVGPLPPYANSEPLVQQYYSQCIQSLLVSFEKSLDEGLGLGPDSGNRYGTEFDVDDLIWMDTATRTKAAGDAIGSGALSPDEARKKYYGLGPVTGGNSPYMQQQYFSLEALAERDAEKPFTKVTPPAPPSDDDEPESENDEDDETMAAQFAARLLRKASEAGLYG
jgi:HK97 family phage portal protein